MIRVIILLIGIFIFSGCMNKHGISAKYYSNCDEYYDFQGYYHKDCGKDDIVTYKEIGDSTKKAFNSLTGKDSKPKGNVW